MRRGCGCVACRLSRLGEIRECVLVSIWQASLLVTVEVGNISLYLAAPRRAPPNMDPEDHQIRIIQIFGEYLENGTIHSKTPDLLSSPAQRLKILLPLQNA